MKRTVQTAIGVAAVVAAVVLAGASQPDSSDHEVVRVVDGDTVRVLIDGQEHVIRVLGLDTPETVHPSQPVECYGPEASAWAKTVLDGHVVLTADPTQDQQDRYGRLLRYVELPDGTDYTEAAIRNGYGTYYQYGDPLQRSTVYERAEYDARADKAGLWGACPS